MPKASAFVYHPVMSRIVLGLRAQKGGAVIVALSLAADGPRLLLSDFLPTAAEGDRLAFEPYAVAAEMDLNEAATAVAEGRKRQDDMAAQGLRAIIGRLEEKPVAAALLVNRAGWITDLLGYSREWAEHIPVAEGLAVREALRFAVARSGLKLVELDEKSLPDRAAQAGIDAGLTALGKVTAKPWRKEQKLACLAAWVA